MKLTQTKVLSIIGLILATSFGIAGCNTGGTNFADNVARRPGICFGRVVDRSTRAGISGAAIEVFAGSVLSDEKNKSEASGSETNFVVATTTASDDADTTLFDESGMWRVDNLPTGDGTGYRVTVYEPDPKLWENGFRKRRKP